MPKTRTTPVKVNLSDGTCYELYYISDLAGALGRSVQTVRKWEISGVIPKTPFEATDKVRSRLYTLEQIDLIRKISEDCNIAQGKPIKSTKFANRLRKELVPLHEEYLIHIENSRANKEY